MTFDFGAFEAAVIGAAMASLEASGRQVASLAKQKAPVRKIFTAEVGLKQIRLARLSDEVLSRKIVTGYKVRFPHHLSSRRLGVVETQELTRRGEYEVKSGRADFRAPHGATGVGGRLRGEIYATPARLEGRVVTVEVISPTSYAKYQEFGTRHNAAHPYMRPAMAESRSAIQADLKRSTTAAAQRAIKEVTGRATVKIVLKAKVS
jgi:HK97 gp10 family phage protein